MLQETKQFLRFDGYLINRPDWTLHWAGERIALTRKSFDLLLYLVDHRDRVASKEELLGSLWAGQFVDESNLTQQIFLLRKALSRHGSGGKIIETVPGRGYRFVAQLEVAQGFGHWEQSHHQSLGNAEHAIGQTPNSGDGEDTDLDLEVSTAHRMAESTESESAIVRSDSIGTGGSSVSRRESPSGILNKASGRLLFSLGAALMCVAVYLAMRSNNPPRWHISAYTRITADGGAKAIGGTDGSRVYFTQLKTGSIQEVSISGGVEVPVKLGENDAWSGDLSPDGSTLLVISQAAGQGPANSLWALHLVGGALRHLADAVVSAAWAPDGKRIICALATGDILLMRHDGSEAKHIASLGGYVSFLSWSPRENTIRFSKDGWLWDMAADGTNVRKLLPQWGHSPTQWSGGWTPDGHYVFVADGQIWVLQEDDGIASSRSKNPIQLTFGPTVWDRPILTPHGSKIVASGRTKRGELVRWDPRSNQFRPFLAGISAEFVVFSNDRKSVAYVTYPDGILWRANADGTNPIQLTEPPSYPKLVRWSPDGSQVAFVERTAEAVDAIFLMASDGSGKPRRLLSNDHQAETDPSWSPDGSKIVFSTAPNVGASGKSDLRIFDFAVNKAILLPRSEGLVVPRWSPDGRFISAMTLDEYGLKLLNLANGKWTTLDTGAVAFPEWSHDGQWIYYVRWTADPAVMRIRADGRLRGGVADLRAVQYTGAYTLWMNLDPADAPMLLRDVGTDDIYALTLERR